MDAFRLSYEKVYDTDSPVLGSFKSIGKNKYFEKKRSCFF